MSTVANRTKKTVSVTVAPELYQQARNANLNFSAILTNALIMELKKVKALEWKQANTAGFDELNRINDEYGLLSDKYKKF
ncbi:type II toxin-antitoxin system CcdA family antitoxin [Providencia stuartii]|uniref:type II toxin-antitoxin system CcdA family antitoxin n=1 Tax=Providencia TaxID=586 RepID=UPI0027F19930|nr:type II toxin-antitoxin system CcdA family antitoxin [Providencia sp. 2023EL-00965]ELR5299231.1 type II toxin-antitoxin system CcdA family antitoxin [Providencia stuartii]MDW7587315.1 type II toxin-antitoxin system CcdA family antitoxin [Providencia sp. 2023EL-00965]